MASLSTSCRAPGGNPTRFVVRAHALSTRELFLDASLEVGELEALIPEALRTGLSIVGLESPCPRPAAARAPWLAGPEADERLEAARLCEATLRRAAELGARVVVVKLGELAGFDAAAVLRKFGRRQLDDEAREKLVETRRSLSLRALDRARFGLERVLDAAAAAGVTLGIANRAFWYEIPSAAETAALVDDLRGAPIAPWYDAAAAHVRRALGFGNGRPAVERAAACGAWLADAAGPRAGLPWGTGEVDPASLADLPAGVPRVVHCLPLATDEELAAALA